MDSECYTVLLNQIAPPEAGVNMSPMDVRYHYLQRDIMLEHWVLPGEVLWIVLHTSRVAQSQSLYWKKISSKY